MRALISLLLLLAASTATAGYDIHVTRKSFWADEVGPKITAEQWQAYVKTDPQVALDTANGPEDFMVSTPSESFPLWYSPQLGEIYTKNPSDAAILKLQDIAESLGAGVQGDDGESYPLKP
jgi:hypothetical protein